jgi:Tfp pilus assembly protein FimV
MKARAQKATAEAKEEFLQTVKDLEKQQGQIKKQLAQLQDSGEKAGQSIKAGIAGAMDELNQAIDQAQQQFS